MLHPTLGRFCAHAPLLLATTGLTADGNESGTGRFQKPVRTGRVCEFCLGIEPSMFNSFGRRRNHEICAFPSNHPRVCVCVCDVCGLVSGRKQSCSVEGIASSASRTERVCEIRRPLSLTPAWT